MNNQQLGKLGEDMASNYLEQKGFRIVKRNYRTRRGEIDIIAARGNELHFVEVKTRHGEVFGRPAESVGKEKIQHMRLAAGDYLLKAKDRQGPGRFPQFDVLEIEINHIENI